MAQQYRIEVVIDPAQASAGNKAVQKELEATENKANSLRSTIARAFAFVGAALAVRELLALTEAYNRAQNRLRGVVEGTAQLNAVTAELFRIANSSRASFEATAELYARIGISAKSLGLSQRELLDFTESLNQAVALSGASAEEASAGILQLSQGLASGALRGDELRSVLEQLPAVADVIAKGLGITRAQLRTFGQEGKITADVVLDAFKKARVELSENFGKTAPTLSQAFTVLKNSAIQFFGELDQSLGVTQTLAKALIGLAGTLQGVAGNMRETLGTLLGIFATAADSIVGFFRGSFNVLGVLFDQLPEHADVAGDLIVKFIRDAVEKVVSFVVAAFQTLGDVMRRVGTLAVQIIANVGGSIGALSKGNIDAAEAFADNTTNSIRLIGQSVLSFGSAFKNNLTKITESGGFLPEVEISDQAREVGNQAAAEFARGFDESTGARDLVKSLAPTATGAPPVDLTQAGAGARSATPRDLEVQKKLLASLKGPLDEYEEQMRVLNQLYKDNKISADEYARGLDQLTIHALKSATDLESGFTRAFASIRLEANDFAKVAEGAVNVFVDNSTRALADFARTGEFSFKDFTRSILGDIAEIIARLFVLQLLQAAVGVFGGPAAGAAVGAVGGGIQGRQAGGDIQPGRLYKVGEDGPELFRSSTAGEIIPNSALQPQAPQIKVVNVTDPNEVTAALATQPGERAVLNVLQRNRATVQRMLG